MKQTSSGILVFDIEALSFDYNAVFLSIGIAYHEWQPIKDIKDICSTNIKLNIKDQISKYKRKIDPSTVEWWKSDKVSKEAKSILNPSDNDESLTDFNEILLDFADGYHIDLSKVDVYNRMPFNAVTKLSMLYENDYLEDTKIPWNIYNQFDIGTALLLLTGDINGNIQHSDLNLTKNNSEHDAILEVYRIINALTENGVLQ